MRSDNSWNQSRNPKVLILGDGYMGSNIEKTLLPQIETLKKGSKDLNYHDPKVFYKFLHSEEITTVINCSGFTGRPNIDEAETKKELCWELNVMSPLRVNQMCAKAGVNYIHISSGCVFDGYQSDWTELDKPNYGLFENHSSFYSKSKHAFEMFSGDYPGKILRIRMPFGKDESSRNYLQKISRYEKLINFQNSKTYIPDLCGVVKTLIENDTRTWTSREIYNVVNPGPLWTEDVCDIMKSYGRQNDNWKFVPFREIETATSRSNCILSSSKVNQIFPLKTETQALHETFQAWNQH